LQGGNCESRIHLLMLAAQRALRFRPRLVNELQRRITFLSALPDDYFGFWSLRR
jgi:hypothetical protein